MSFLLSFRRNVAFLALIVLTVLPGFVALPAAARGLAQSRPQAAGDEFWDDRFSLPGIYEGRVYAVAVNAAGEVFVGGTIDTINGLKVNNIARWDGRRWHALGSGISGGWARVNDFAVSGNSLYVAGDFTNAGGVALNKLARWDGTQWSAVGNGTGPQRRTDYGVDPAEIYAIAVSGNNLYVGGDFNQIDGVPANGIARWDGTTWHALGNGVGKRSFEGNFVAEGRVYSIVVSGNNVYAGGAFGMAGPSDAYAIAVWDGTNWAPLGGGLTTENQYEPAGDVRAIAVNGNTVYAGGAFSRAGGQPAANIAVWNGTAWSAMGAGVSRDYASNPLVDQLLMRDGLLYVSGGFKRAGGQELHGLATWNGTSWAAVPGSPKFDYDPELPALALAPDNSLYVGGSFTQLSNGQMVYNIARWNGTAWQQFGQGIAKFGDTPAEIYALAADDTGRIYAGGTIGNAGSMPVKNLAMWDGTAWQNIGEANDLVYAVQVVGDDVYVGGNFTQIGGIAANRIARYNRTTGQWSALGNGINGTVYALTYGEGILFAGGAFKSAGDVTAEDVAAWDGQKWNALGGGYRIYERSKEGGEIGTYVRALAFSGEELIIGGHFQTIQKGTNTTDISSFLVVHNVVRWNLKSGEWNVLGTLLNPGVSSSGYSGFGTDVYAVEVIGNEIFVGGKFNQAGSSAGNGVARYNRVTNSWAAMDSGIGGVDDPTVRDFSAIGTELFAAGSFTSAGNAQARFVARWDTTTNSWSALGSGMKWYNDRYTTIYSVVATPTGVYFGGNFTSAGEKPALGFARWGAPLNQGNLTAEQGGTIEGGDGVSISFPAGAVAGNTMVTYTAQAATNKPLPQGKGVVRSFHFTAQDLQRRPVTQFAQPYTLRVSYTDEQMRAAGVTDPAALNLAYWNGNAWVTMLPCAGCSVDPVQKIITVVSDHFTEFALFGDAPVVAPPPGGSKVYLPVVVR